MKRILNKALFPGLITILICVAVTIALLAYIFALEHKDSPIAYPAYVFSAYTMVIACIWIVKKARGIKECIERTIKSIPILNRYLTDAAFKIHVSLYLSLGINILYAAMKMVSGFYYHSVWFGTLSVYYMLLALMRFLLLRKAEWGSFGRNVISEWKKYRLCGWLLLIMNIALSGVVILVICKNEGFQYAGYLIYVMALYAFYTIITAVLNVIKYRKYNSPVMSAAKAINLAAALVSMLSLETAMLAQFNNGENPEEFRRMMTGATGAGVCLIVLGMAIYLILRSTNQLRKLNGQNMQP
ncbi:MAG: hypothetical protein Q4E86_01995 [Lachnospiraceae bacterium]|nr:hypothetical protein [Lachnospiraceae bacterium]